MSQEINRQELVRQLRGLFGFRGATGFELGEVVMPVANLGDLDQPPWHSKRAGITTVQIGPIAAQFSYVGLRANALIANDFRAVIRYILVSTGGLMNVLMSPVNNILLDGTVALPALQSPLGSWDTPVAGAATDVNRPQMVGYQQTSVSSFLTALQTISFPGRINVFDIIPGPFVIAPGNTLLLQGAAINTALVASIYWDEYSLG